jgi:hypothetical protein
MRERIRECLNRRLLASDLGVGGVLIWARDLSEPIIEANVESLQRFLNRLTPSARIFQLIGFNFLQGAPPCPPRRLIVSRAVVH